MLTKGNFIRDEWNHFLVCFTTWLFWMLSCSHFNPFKTQNHVEEVDAGKKKTDEPVVATSKPTSLVSRSGSIPDGCIRQPAWIMECKVGIQILQTSTNRSREMWTKTPHPVLKCGIKMENPRPTSKWTAKTQNRLTETRLTHHNLEISNTPHFTDVFANVQPKLSRPEEGQMLDFKVNVMIWDYSCQWQWRQQCISGCFTKKPGHHQEHRLRGTEDIVRYCAAIDPRKTRHQKGSQRSYDMFLLGEDLLCMTKKSSCQKQEYTFTRIQCFFLERCIHTLQQWWSGKSNLNISWTQRIIKNYLASMESHLSSRGIFSPGTVQWNFSRRSEKNGNTRNQNRRIRRWCSRTSISRKVKQIPMDVFPNSVKGQRLRRKMEGTLIFCRSWWWIKMVWNGTHDHKTEGQWNRTANVTELNSERSGHPVFWASSALDQGYFRKNCGKYSMHFSGDTSNAQLFVSHNWFSQSAQCFADQSRIGVMNWLSKSLVSHLRS